VEGKRVNEDTLDALRGLVTGATSAVAVVIDVLDREGVLPRERIVNVLRATSDMPNQTQSHQAAVALIVDLVERLATLRRDDLPRFFGPRLT
jgi:hypothetical protein